MKFNFTEEFPAAPPKCTLSFARLASNFVMCFCKEVYREVDGRGPSLSCVSFGLTVLFVPPGWFATKIFHPNVSSSGEICVNTLKKDWQSSFGIGHILVTVKCLLIYPNPESALDEEAGKLLLEDYESYSERARLITSVHATPKVRSE